MYKMSKSICCVVLTAVSMVSINTLKADVPVQPDLPINQNPGNRPTHVHNEVIVRFKPRVSTSAANQMAAQYTSHVHKRLGKNSEFHLLRLQAGQTVEEAMAQLKSDPNVDLVEPNYFVYAAAVPNDTHYGNLWGLKNTGQTVNLTAGTVGADIDAESAWDHITDCRTAIVAVIDTGIHYNHQDLATNIWTNTGETAGNGLDDDGNGKIDDTRGWDFVSNDNNPFPNAAHESHGTHVAGTIGAVGNNAKGVTGVCWQARIMPLRVLNEDGIGTAANLADAINYAVAKSAKVINLSLSTDGGDIPVVRSATDNALSNGVVIVAAAGNSSANNDNTPVYPCNYTHANVICVAALDQDHALASFSNSGAASVDLGAPGRNVYSNSPGRLIVDTLTGWTKTGAWAELPSGVNSCTEKMLANPGSPPNYCAQGPYADNADDVAYKIFDVTNVSNATLRTFAKHKIDTTLSGGNLTDYVSILADGTGANPSIAGTNIDTISGDSGTNGNDQKLYTTPLGACLTATCAVGFRLVTDAATTSRGIGIVSLFIETLQTNPEINAYGFSNGTSMAAPHVSGVAAMLRAFNPNFTHQDTVNALRDSGDPQASLNGVTVSGRSLNAMNALRYVNAPRGVTATVQ